MIESIRFREAIGEDAGIIADLHTRSWRNTYRGILPDSYLDGPIVSEKRDAWRKRLSSPVSDRQLVVLAIHRQAPIGFVCVLLDEEPARGACLDNLHVVSDFQGIGIGRRLFARAAGWVSVRDPGRPMHLWVFEENHPARRFYDFLGGEICTRELKRVGGVEVPALCYSWKDIEAVTALALKGLS